MGSPTIKRLRNGDAKSVTEPIPRSWTVSVAVPGDAIDMCDDLKTRSKTVLRLANALSSSTIDHVILLPSTTSKSKAFLTKTLTYLETPPYMRSRLFTPGDIEIEPALAYLASLPESKTTLPHHNNVTEDSLYRDGVTLRAEHWSTKHRLVNVGFNDGILASIPDAFPKRVRLAVRLTSLVPAEGERSIPATIVSPTEAREELGQYMGFTISTTPSLASMFEECPFEGGYDLSILMSDAGEAGVGQLSTPDTLSAMNYLIVFADSEKLDILAGADKQLQELEIDTPAQLFDHAVDLTKITDNPEILETAVDMVNGGLHALSSFLAMRLEQ